MREFYAFYLSVPLNQPKISYMFAVLIAFFLIALLIIACNYYFPEKPKGKGNPVTNSLMGF